MPNISTIRIGTRKSPLALAQAGQIRDRLLEHRPDISVELVHITTSGDRFLDRPLADIGGKGLFTKEIEEALLDRSIDMAVHSVKDMQTLLPDGLMIGCIPEREDPRDVLIGKNVRALTDLPPGASFGTSSLRRAAQVLMHRPDLRIAPLRGNVQTRIHKIEQSEIDATMLAMAGLKRLSLSLGTPLATTEILPAVGQGALAIECRAGDARMLDLLAPLHHSETAAAVTCERAFLRALDGSCRTPIAGYAIVSGDALIFDGLLIDPEGKRPRRVHRTGQGLDAERIGADAGAQIKDG